MGNAVSSGRDNDELTDNLIRENFLMTPMVKRVFRAVDRAEYILPQYRANAYRDQAWRCKQLHLSAPCIYAKVMEALCLRAGLSFLNLGSGTGYLSTMVGLIVGSRGINHGVELHDDVIVYAKKKLEDFKRHSGAIDEFDFCEPKFIQGNCLSLNHDLTYDRIYVGAACPQQKYLDEIRAFLKEDGILVMPYKDTLLQVRKTKDSWKVEDLLPVSFATLITPKTEAKTSLDLYLEPESLQALCRSMIRQKLREKIQLEEPDLVTRHENRKMSVPETNGDKSLTDLDGNELISVPNSVNYPLSLFWDSLRSGSSTQPSASSGTNDDEHHRKKVVYTGISDEELSDDELVEGQNKRTKLTVIEIFGGNNGAATNNGGTTITTNENRRSSSSSDDTSYSDYKDSDHSSSSSTSCLTDSSESVSGGGGNLAGDTNEEEGEETVDDEKTPRKPVMVSSPFTKLVCVKINELPLPFILKSYLSYDKI